MKILFLAPQPFFTERGTPIAVRLAVQAMASFGHEVDLVTYPEGQDLSIPGVNLIRSPNFPKISGGIRPGISIKKILRDLGYLFFVINLFRKRRREYDLVHAVEEAVFIAVLIKFIFGVPYVYDMDSCLTTQLVDRWSFFRPLRFIFSFIEGFAARKSLAVIAVCESLAKLAEGFGSKFTAILHDISLFGLLGADTISSDEILSNDKELKILYVGNLEPYQGIDLLIESFVIASKKHLNSKLFVIGGGPVDVQKYIAKCKLLGIDQRVRFIGPKPLGLLQHYAEQSDILVSPRINGTNTPMKIYSYMHAGKAILATNLLTHTQVLTSDSAVLAEPEPKEFAAALEQLLNSESDRLRLGENAKRLAEEHFTYPAFEKKLQSIYLRISELLGPRTSTAAATLEKAS